jgi:molybdenum cofactor cytidylyltransferase
MSRVSVIILAAGGSTRLGRSKQSVLFAGETLLRRAVKTALFSGSWTEVIVVLGADSELAHDSLSDLTITQASNPQWKSGMGSSLRVGMKAMRHRDETDAVIIMACDQPMVSAELLQNLAGVFESSDASIVASRYANTAGVPALFAKRHFDALDSLPDDQGAKLIIRKNPEAVATIDFPEGIVDVDTENDVAQLAKLQPAL